MLTRLENLKFVFQSTLIIILTTSFFVMFYISSSLFFSALIGVGVSCIISPIIDWLESKYNFNRFVATLLFLTIIGLLFLLVFFISGKVLVQQFDSLKEDLPNILQSWKSIFQKYSHRYPILSADSIDDQTSQLATGLMSALGTTLSALLNTLTGLSLATIIALFTTANSKSYFTGTLELFPKKYQDNLKASALRAAVTLRKWAYAQLLDMLVVGALTTVGLFVCGIKYWALYGFLSGLLSVIPYAGLIIVFTFSAAIIAVTQINNLIPLCLVFIITQNLEGNFIMPKLMKDLVKIPSAPLIFLLILMGSWFGIIGALITTPIFAIVMGELNSNQKDT